MVTLVFTFAMAVLLIPLSQDTLGGTQTLFIRVEFTHGSGTECVIVPRCLGKSSSATRVCPSRSSERPVISAYLFFCRPSAIASMASIPSASGQNLQTLGFIGHQEQE